MAKWDVDYDDYEDKSVETYDGDPPRNGTYEGELRTYKAHENGNSDTSLEWRFVITEEPYVGWMGWIYSDLENSKWKTQEICKAIQGGETKKIRLNPEDPEHVAKVVKRSKPVKMVVKNQKYEGEMRPKLTAIRTLEAAGTKKASSDDPWADEGDDD